jgi:hypothetical protein
MIPYAFLPSEQNVYELKKYNVALKEPFTNSI